MKRDFYLFILVSCLLGFGCVSTNQAQQAVLQEKTSVPKWITDQGRQELFPDSQFVSQLAYGSSAQDSKEKASANISEYVKSSVVSSTSSKYFYSENNNSYRENKEFKEDITISTNNTLYKIEYTNPYYYADLGQFVCVAFINRNQAFNFVKPKLEKAKTNFVPNYTNALAKESLFEKISGIKNAQSFLEEFYEVYDFARAIVPEKAKAYETVDALATESFAKIKEISSSILIKIEGVGDTDLLEKSGVVAELAQQFEKLGFVVGNSLKGNCLALVEVKSSLSKTKETYESYPEITVRVLENGEEKISYSKKLSKVAGFDKATVERRVNIALLKEIRTSFLNECL